MSGDIGDRKRRSHSRNKVKTGCETCRIRRIKCDEQKPHCQRCVSTGRTCDYKSMFRLCGGQTVRSTETLQKRPKPTPQSIQHTSTNITAEDIDRLNRHLSTKTIFNIDLGCNEEAKQLLQASLSDSTVKHALSSLRALREDLETSGESSATPSFDYGLHQYNMALKGLVSNLSVPSPNSLKSALLCCQIFISIEQVQNNYTAVAQHIIRGLKIMHEYRARPYLTTTKVLMPAQYAELPFLDVYIIKLFAAPCKFSDSPITPDTSETTTPTCPMSPHPQLDGVKHLRAIVPNTRAELVRVATLVLEFLTKVTRAETAAYALQLLSEKRGLIDTLQAWLTNLDRVQIDAGPAGTELVSVSFMRMFYSILKIVLLNALRSSPEEEADSEFVSVRLQSLADSVGERLVTYTMHSVVSSAQSRRALA